LKILDILDKFDKMKTRTFFIVAAVAFLVAIAIGVTFNFNIELLEINEIGEQYTSIFWTNFFVEYATMLMIFLVIFLALYLTNGIIIKNLKKFFKDEKKEPVRFPNKSIAFFIALVAAFFLKEFASQNILLYLNSTFFATSEHVFGKDVGYYIFQRPFLIDMCNFAKGLILSLIVYTIGYYVVAFGTCFNGIELKSLKKNGVINHNVANAVIFLIIMIISYTFTMEDALFGQFADGFVGAGFTDVNIKLVAYKVAQWLIAIVGLVAYIFIERNKYKKALITVAVIPVFWVLTYVLISFTQLIYVAPNEFLKESEFIKYNMKNTKQAYGINYIDEKDYNVIPNLTSSDIKNSEIINNIQIVSEDATLKALNQSQTSKDFYKFNDADITNYTINGMPTLSYVSAREIDITEKLNYTQQRFTYTHGFGVVMNSINSVNKDGEVEFVLNEVKPEVAVGDLKITEPRIYFGEEYERPIVVNAKDIDEFDYFEGNDTITTRYNGTAGIKMNLWNKLLMSIKNLDARLLVSDYIDADSKLLINRNIIDRAKTIAPFLKYDKDAYLVANNEGKLFWIINAYTVSSYYPYSEYFETSAWDGMPTRYNYIRNSVKVVVDAYNGDITFYMEDSSDPIAMAYAKAYPELFTKEEMPEDIKSHVTYPKTLFEIQAKMLEKYHVNDVGTLYKSENVWDIATHQTGEKVENIEPYYIYTKILGKDAEELALVIPYTPAGRNNLTSMFLVTMDGEKIVYKFSNETPVLGTIQLDNKIDQDSDIAREIIMWEGTGVKISRDVKVIPINNSLIYVEPIYIEAVNEDAIPQLKKVIVAYNNSVATASNLEGALKTVINNESGTIKIDINEEVTDVPEDLTIKELIDDIADTYDEVKQASKDGDWEEFGNKMKELEDKINELDKKKNEM